MLLFMISTLDCNKDSLLEIRYQLIGTKKGKENRSGLFLNKGLVKRTIYITCQLGTKNGTPSLTPVLFATKMWPNSCTPRRSAVTNAPGRPSDNKLRLSNVDLEH